MLHCYTAMYIFFLRVYTAMIHIMAKQVLLLLGLLLLLAS